ncbi:MULTISPECIES: sensor histidine kinase [unclassified Streptomyces]|uniref:sensor histidine kinase n=1 Tax=unclassified Streptomyces TaxID=2593676 RepID=UPI003830C7AB
MNQQLTDRITARWVDTVRQDTSGAQAVMGEIDVRTGEDGRALSEPLLPAQRAQLAKELAISISRHSVAIWRPDRGEVIHASGAFGQMVNPRESELVPRIIASVPQQGTNSSANENTFDGRKHIDGVEYYLDVTPTHLLPGQLIIATSDPEGKALLSVIGTIRVWAGITFIAVTAIAAWFSVSRSVRRLQAIAVTAEQIAAGDRSHRVPLPADGTEIGKAATALNTMLDENEKAFADLHASELRMVQFIGDASHELRTPLAVVRAYAEVLRGGHDIVETERERALTRIEAEATRMTTLVSDLLTLSRLDADTAPHRERVDLAGLATDSVTDMRLLSPGHAITASISGDCHVHGDPDQLHQMLVNLLANTHRHTPPGTQVTVTVTGGPHHVQVSVRDDGPGLTADQAVHVFDRFFRADTSRQRMQQIAPGSSAPDGSGSGAGLGLSIVAAIVTAHHGTVTVGSRPGEGATFALTLPAAASLPHGDPAVGR